MNTHGDQPMSTQTTAGPATHAGHPSADDDDLSGRVGWLQGVRRIAPVLPVFASGEARFQCEGMRRAVPIRANAVWARLDGDYTPREFLAVRPTQGELAVAPWVVDGTAVLWASDELGLVAFRVPCVGVADGALLVALPETAVRFSRRAEPRVVPPLEGEGSVGAVVAGDSARHAGTVLNISASGLQLDVPDEVAASPGVPLSLLLRLDSPRELELGCDVCHREVAGPGRVHLGLRFRDMARLDRLTLERFLARHAAETPIDRQPANTLPRPLFDLLHTPQAQTPFHHPAADRLPAVALMIARSAP